MRSPLGALARTVQNKAPVPYVSRGIRYALPSGLRNDAEQQLRAMETVGTLFAIVDRLASATAEVEWKLWRKTPSGKPEDRVEVTSHLALDIWRKPNPWMPGQEFVETFQQHMDLAGEAWWVVARNPKMRSIPLELWPVRPDRMMPVPHPTEFISGYIYRGPDGEQVPLRVDEVIMLRRPHPRDPYRGISPVGTILPDLEAGRLSAEWNRNFFHNSALPSGIIEAPTNLGDTEFDELRDRWDEQHRGVAAAHRVAILEGGLKWVDRKFTQRDMEFVETRGATREIIREAYAIHGHTLGLSQDINRANAEAADTTFARWQVKPRCGRIKQALNFDFLPLFGDTARGLEWDFVNPVPEDREAANVERTSKASAAATYITAGFTGESVVEALELPETLVWREPPAKQPAPPAIPPAPTPDDLLRALRAQVDLEETREDWQERLDDLLADWEQVTEDQRAELLEQVRAAVVAAAPADLAALTASSSAGAALLEAALIEQAEAAGERMVATAEDQGVAITAAVVAGVLAAGLAATAAVTAGLLAAALAVAAGREALRVWSSDADEVTGRVRGFLEGFSDASLRTELGGAVWSAEAAGRYATLQLADDEGNGATYYVATEERDRNTCIQCADVDGERFDTLRDVKESYPHGGYFACLGTIRCRGTVEPHWGES